MGDLLNSPIKVMVPIRWDIYRVLCKPSKARVTILGTHGAGLHIAIEDLPKRPLLFNEDLKRMDESVLSVLTKHFDSTPYYEETHPNPYYNQDSNAKQHSKLNRARKIFK